MTVFETFVLMLLPAILFAHYLGIFVDSNSRYQKWKFRKSLDCIVVRLDLLKNEITRYPTVDFVYKNRNFRVGIHKKEHNHRYTTYEIFINDEAPGVYHMIGDCCTQQYYFEKLNNREQYEVMEIINVCAKKIRKENKKRTKEVAERASSWNEFSYFK